MHRIVILKLWRRSDHSNVKRLSPVMHTNSFDVQAWISQICAQFSVSMNKRIVFYTVLLNLQFLRRLITQHYVQQHQQPMCHTGMTTETQF